MKEYKLLLSKRRMLRREMSNLSEEIRTMGARLAMEMTGLSKGDYVESIKSRKVYVINSATVDINGRVVFGCSCSDMEPVSYQIFSSAQVIRHSILTDDNLSD